MTQINNRDGDRHNQVTVEVYASNPIQSNPKKKRDHNRLLEWKNTTSNTAPIATKLYSCQQPIQRGPQHKD